MKWLRAVWILMTLAAMRVEGQEAPLGGARPVYIMLYMHHYIGGGGFYPTAQDIRAFAELTQKYQVPVTFFFDGILREMIREAMTIGGFENDFFWYMNRLQYKAGRQRTAKNLPFRFMEVGLTATPPRWMDGVEDRLRQLSAQVRAVPGSRFMTPDELAGLFEPQNGQPISRDELRRLAEKLLADWKDAPPDFVDLGERGYLLVNACEALAKALAHYGEKRVLPDRVTATDLYGPIAERGEITYCKAGEVSLSDLCAVAAATLKDAERLTPRRVPIKVAIGKSELNCAEFLRAMAQAYVALAKGNTPATVRMNGRPAFPLTERCSTSWRAAAKGT